MDKQQLIELRQQIISTAMPFVLNGETSPDEKASLLLDIIKIGRADKEIYLQAFEVIKKIEDDSIKVSLLLDLLSEVEANIETIDNQPEKELPASENQIKGL